MQIFISHSSKDANYGNLLVELLRSIGIKENEIIFTSNVAYGIPVGQNIFNWLKSKIEEKPFVIYLLSEDYYKSVACLNEMGAAWIVENENVAIFSPNFDLTGKEFRNGAIDPRSIGFYINDEDRILTFIDLLSANFDISNNRVIISQSVKRFITAINKIIPDTVEKKVSKIAQPLIVETKNGSEKTQVIKLSTNSVGSSNNDLYSKFLNFITI